MPAHGRKQSECTRWQAAQGWRERLGLSTRDVQAMSRQIASQKQNEEFYLSHNWVTDIENGQFRPGMFRMASISVIYSLRYTEVASHYGLQIGDLRRDMASIHPRKRICSKVSVSQKPKQCRYG